VAGSVLTVRDARAGDPGMLIQPVGAFKLTSIAYSPDGRRILVGAEEVFASPGGRTALQLWDASGYGDRLPAAQPASSLRLLWSAEGVGDVVAVSPDGRSFASAFRQ